MKLMLLEDVAKDRDALLDLIHRYVCQNGYDLSVMCCLAPEEILNESCEFDAVLLDILIGGRPAGIDVARALRRRGFHGPIAFLTSSCDYYAEGFEVDAVHYLVKPYTYEAFSEAMERMIRLAGHSRRTVEFLIGRRRVRMAEEEIIYAEVHGKITVIHTRKDKLRVRLPLRVVEKLLSSGPFLRCFRNCIVNMEHIVRAEEENFVLDNGERVPITIRCKEEIKGQYLDYQFERIRRNEHE